MLVILYTFDMNERYIACDPILDLLFLRSHYSIYIYLTVLSIDYLNLKPISCAA